MWTRIIFTGTSIAVLMGCGGNGTKELAEASCELLQGCDVGEFERLYESFDDCVDQEAAFHENLYESEKGNRGKDCAKARVEYDTCVAVNADCEGETNSCGSEENNWQQLCE